MEMATFLGIASQHVNIMSAITMEHVPAARMKERFLRSLQALPKLRYALIEILGDFYYQEMTIEEIIDLVFVEVPPEKPLFKNQGDIDRYVEANLNEPFRMGRPQYQILWQESGLADSKETVMIWKQHHSLSDGASIISFILSWTDNYDPSYLIPIKEIKWYEKLLLRVGSPFHMLRALAVFMRAKVRLNLLHDGKRALSGKKRVASSRSFDLAEIKQATKALGATMNDMVMACLASGLKQYMEGHGDMNTDKVHMVIPANIRFQHYSTLESLRLENKFAVVPLEIPLHADLQTSMKAIPLATAKIRRAFNLVYATYVATKFTLNVLPYFVANAYLNMSTLPFTLAFSNVPGLLKPVTVFGQKHLGMSTYIQTSSYCGLTVACVSYIDKIKLTCVADDTIMRDPASLIACIEHNIERCL
jgi:hypothetical protein